jgi:CRP-like cAMP-binding protein
MSSIRTFQTPFENRILAALPREEYERLVAHAEMVRLATGNVLYRPEEHVRHVYLPRGGMISLVSVLETGSSVEVAMVGNEGVAGIFAVLRLETTPYQITVQLPSNALRVKASVFRQEFDRGSKLQDIVLRYTRMLLAQISQSAACNRFHTLEERLCRWLLTSRDRVRTDTFDLTQEFLSQMMGAPRTRVTIVMNKLRDEGLISYSRGKIQLVDRRMLESSACECYGVIARQLDHYIAA